MTSFSSALLNDDLIVMDGAMGTELTRIGEKIGFANWVASSIGLADDVSRIHRSYAEAGAQVHITNTFATGRHVLESVGLADQFERINRESVRVCRDAVAGAGPEPKWIAGSISTYVVGSDRANLPTGHQLETNVREQADVLHDAGCGLIVLEMLFDVETTATMMAAAASVGLPVSVGMTCQFDDDGDVALRGRFSQAGGSPIKLDRALPQIVAATTDGVPWLMTIMHSDLDVTDAALKVVATHWDGPIGAYPNSGRLQTPDTWDNDNVCSPGEFADRALAWHAAGVKMIGGCCGIGPNHLAAFCAATAASLPSP